MKKYLFFLLMILIITSCSPNLTRVACIGDSITEGATLVNQSETSYPRMLGHFLGPKYVVLNCGRSATTLQKKGDFPYWISKEFWNTFQFKPQIVVIKLGTNDTKPQNWVLGDFEKDYQALLDTIRTMTPSPKIFVCLPVPVYESEWGINDSTLVQGVLPIVKKLAERNKLTVIDLYHGMSNQPLNFPDHIHPNEQGAKNMAEIVARKILSVQ